MSPYRPLSGDADEQLAAGHLVARERPRPPRPGRRRATISFSIFIASTTTSTCPAATSSPALDVDLEHGALHRAADDVHAAVRRAVPLRHRGPAGAQPRPSGMLGLDTVTSKRRPSTSTGTVRGSRSAAGPAPSARRPLRPGARAYPPPSTNSRIVPPAANSGCSRIAVWIGISELDAPDLELGQRAQHPPPGVVAVGAEHDQLGDHRVVQVGDHGALDHARSRPARPGRTARGSG